MRRSLAITAVALFLIACAFADAFIALAFYRYDLQLLRQLHGLKNSARWTLGSINIVASVVTAGSLATLGVCLLAHNIQAMRKFSLWSWLLYFALLLQYGFLTFGFILSCIILDLRDNPVANLFLMGFGIFAVLAPIVILALTMTVKNAVEAQVP